jgi:tripartite-type tricarboxylate transporter receptor subunit TctC
MGVARIALRAAALAFLLTAAGTPHALAQAPYPAKNIQMIVPYTAGGSIDVIARAVAQHLGEAWGKTIVIDNKPGASGMIGTEIVTKAEPDGYTLLAHTSSYPATAAVRAKLPFDPARAIVPVAAIARAPNLVAVHPSVPAHSVKELVALARSKPDTIHYGSSGTGGNNHFSGAMFATAAGIRLVHVPYKGIAPAVNALASGEVELVIASQAALLPVMRSNRVRILAITSAQRAPRYPELPTVIEAGVPGYTYELWWGIFAPAGLPDDRLAFINAAVSKIITGPEMGKFLDNEGAEAWPQTPAGLHDLLPREIERYRKAAEQAGIKPQ